MKILVVCPRYEYGDEKRDYSYDYRNFFLTLRSLKFQTDIFDFFMNLNFMEKRK